MEKRNILIFVIVIIFSFFIFDAVFNPKTVNEIPMSLTVHKEGIGINVDTDAIYFGAHTPDSTIRRFINITNNETKKICIRTNIKGELKKWTSVYPKNFFLQPNQTIKLTVSVEIPSSARIGNYTGYLQLIYSRF